MRMIDFLSDHFNIIISTKAIDILEDPGSSIVSPKNVIFDILNGNFKSRYFIVRNTIIERVYSISFVFLRWKKNRFYINVRQNSEL
jgi:hypothetical protein